MDKEKIEFIQLNLNKEGSDLIVDGVCGPATLAEIRDKFEIPDEWTFEKCIIGYIQLLGKSQGIYSGVIDGYWGSMTSNAYDLMTKAPHHYNPHITSNWPQQLQSELIRYYGPVGENQTRIVLPYPHRLAWDVDKIINSYSCHEKVHDSLKRILTKTLSHYGPEEIQRLRLDLWGGCLNVRNMRGGTSYSTHSWGIAVDYDPERNQLRWGCDKASFAKAEYNAWWNFWDEEGWVSLGRTKNRDWMHVQATK